MYNFLKDHRKFFIYFPLVIYWLILFALTSLPTKMAISVGVNDKIEHFGAYGLLSVFLYLSLTLQEKYQLLNKYAATFSVLIASFYGMLDEFHQMLVPGRSTEFLDWLADFLGSVLAVLISRFIFEKLKMDQLKKST